MGKSRTNVASVGSVFNDTRKVKVLSLPETIKEKSTFRAKALRRELAVGIGENHLCFYTSTSRDKIKANQIDFIKSNSIVKSNMLNSITSERHGAKRTIPQEKWVTSLMWHLLYFR